MRTIFTKAMRVRRTLMSLVGLTVVLGLTLVILAAARTRRTSSALVTPSATARRARALSTSGSIYKLVFFIT